MNPMLAQATDLAARGGRYHGGGSGSLEAFLWILGIVALLIVILLAVKAYNNRSN